MGVLDVDIVCGRGQAVGRGHLSFAGYKRALVPCVDDLKTSHGRRDWDMGNNKDPPPRVGEDAI